MLPPGLKQASAAAASRPGPERKGGQTTGAAGGGAFATGPAPSRPSSQGAGPTRWPAAPRRENKVSLK
eukprot:2174819-Pyramimonas_sp.AAC.1